MKKEIIIFDRIDFEKGYEFARTLDGRKVFCHKNNIDDFRYSRYHLMQAEIVSSPKGLEAKNVTFVTRATKSKYLAHNRYPLPGDIKPEAICNIEAWLPWSYATVRNKEEYDNTLPIDEAEKENMIALEAITIVVDSQDHLVVVDGIDYSCVAESKSLGRRYYRKLRNWRENK